MKDDRYEKEDTIEDMTAILNNLTDGLISCVLIAKNISVLYAAIAMVD